MIAAVWLAAALSGAHRSPSCVFRPGLSDVEAVRLLKQTPAALGVRPHAVEVEASPPSSALPRSRTFSGALVSRAPDDGALDNGLLGYFAVDRRTGAVTSLADFSTVRGAALSRLRAAFCAGRSRPR